MNYHPGTIYIDQEAVNLSFTKAITAQYPQIDPIIIDPREVKSKLFDQVASLTKGKQILYLKKFQGDALKLCPGYSDEVLCCNYQVIDLVENCPLECVYCILQAFLNKPIITFHVNVEEIIEKTIKGLKLLADRQIRVGTGEHSDSLALDDIFKVNPYLIDVFSRLKNVTLELKTKTDKLAVIAIFEEIEKTQNIKVIHNNIEPLVSLDFLQSEYSVIVDHRWTDVINGNLLKMVLWYDNEWGYSSRVVDQVKYVSEKIKEIK